MTVFIELIPPPKSNSDYLRFLFHVFFQDEEISMLGEVTHLQGISDDLKALTSDPHKLPPASEQVRKKIKQSLNN